MDSDGLEVDPQHRIQPWTSVIVQQASDDVAFDLSMRLTGFGIANILQHGLHTSQSWCSTGLWHLDQIVRSDLLLTWTGLGFTHLTCWLPFFAEAVLELWPCTVDVHLQAWLESPHTQIYAIVWEEWG